MGKKFTLSFSLIVVFILYSFLFRSESLYVSPAASIGQNNKSVGGLSSQSNSSVPTSDSNTNNQPAVIRRYEDDREGEDGGYTSAPPAPQLEPVFKTPATIPAKPAPSNPPVVAPLPPKQVGLYKDGQYTGSVADAYYGNVQVKAVISGGKIADVQFLDYPQDRGTSIRINFQAMPYLTSEAIQAQSVNVDTISGATETSRAFRESLDSALAQAKN